MHTHGAPLLALAACLAFASEPAAAQNPQQPIFTDVVVWERAACGLTDGGDVYCWGSTEFDRTLQFDERQRVVRPQCGFYYCSLGARRVPLPGPAAALVTATVDRANPGGVRSFVTDLCALGRDGRLLCWTETGVAAVERGGLQFRALEGGGSHTCGLDGNGASWCWGLSADGQLGDGNRPHERYGFCVEFCELAPVRTAGTVTFRTIGVGGAFSCGLGADSSAYCWGMGRSGRLGDGTGRGRNVPTAVAGGRKWRALSVGGGHVCGVATDGTAYCWGAGAVGQLGTDSLRDRAEPTPVAGGLQFASVSAGAATTCGVTQDGVAYCWGIGNRGQRGDSTLTERVAHPVAVAGGVRFAAVSAGVESACGIAVGGRELYCWGRNNNGQLGSGSRDDSPVPVRVTMR